MSTEVADISPPTSYSYPVWENVPWVWNRISQILEVAELDIDDTILSLIRSRFPQSWENFYPRDALGILKRYSPEAYIRLEKKNAHEIHIDMMQTPGRWEEAMLDIWCYCIENDYEKITWKVQPQKNPSERRKKILLDKWINFWFTSRDGTHIKLELTEENKRVILNKIKYYLKNGKWFTGKISKK